MSGVVSAIKEFLRSEDAEYEIITIESLKQSEKSFRGRLRQHDPSYSDEADHGNSYTPTTGKQNGLLDQ